MCCCCRCGERGLDYNVEWGSYSFRNSFIDMGMDATGFQSGSFMAKGAQENINRSKYGLKSRRFLFGLKVAETKND